MADEALQYWKGSVAPTLREALVKMSNERPPDPVTWLGEWCKLASLDVARENT